MQLRTKATLYRGGTSKAMIVHTRNLPTQDRTLLQEWLLAAFGSPDPRQIDGIGGADMLTSKFAFVGPPSVPGADVDYTFAQVGVDAAYVDWTILCGNISSAIGPFAIEEGYVAATGASTMVRVHNTNTGKIYTARVETDGGLPRISGDAVVDGVPSSGSPIALDFKGAGGAITGKLLPTGRRRDSRYVPGLGPVEYSVIDMTGLFVFVHAEQFGLSASADPRLLESQADRLGVVDAFRAEIGKEFGIDSPITPAVLLIGKSADWDLIGGVGRRSASDADLHVRCTAIGKVHSSIPITGTMATGVAASLPGSVVSDVIEGAPDPYRIGHPSGVVSIQAVSSGPDPAPEIVKAEVIRTARRIFDGAISVDPARLSKPEEFSASDPPLTR
ncbi:PrpF domain-containing protein [Nocardia fluminea]|uniref:PrpF domain-containing protein n=1 Tax=Nocardia fluminea TaxID=134984 RepID=UPI00343DFF48